MNVSLICYHCQCGIRQKIIFLQLVEWRPSINYYGRNTYGERFEHSLRPSKLLEIFKETQAFEVRDLIVLHNLEMISKNYGLYPLRGGDINLSPQSI